MGFELPGLGGHAVVVAALVVATNLAPTAGLDGLADYTGAAACALATDSAMQDSACRTGAPATDPAAADTATDSAATTGDRADRDTATASPGVVADRRPADCPRTSPAPDSPGADHDPPTSSPDTAEHARATTATTVDEARDEDGGSDRRRRDADDADESDGDADGPAPRHPPGVHERDDERDSAGDRTDTPSPAVPATKAPLGCLGT